MREETGPPRGQGSRVARTGVLVVRVYDESAEPYEVHGHITARLDVLDGPEEVSDVIGAMEIQAFVAHWLARFLADAPGRRGR